MSSASSYNIILRRNQGRGIRTDLDGRHLKIKIDGRVVIEVDMLVGRMHIIDHNGMSARLFVNAIRRFFHLSGCKRYDATSVSTGTLIVDRISNKSTLIPYGETAKFVLPHVSIMLLLARFDSYVGTPKAMILPWIKQYAEDRGAVVTDNNEPPF